MIFWKHIKGLSPDNIYTFLRFKGEEVTTDMASLPRVYLSSSTIFSEGSETADCGHLLTSNMENGLINNDFSFYNAVYYKKSTNELKVYCENQQWLFESAQSIKATGNVEIDGKLSITNNTSATSTEGALTVTGGIMTYDNLYVAKSAKIVNKCEANYFNATSDYRAKKDFKLLDIDALNLIKKVQLYSFKYKESNQPSIGIIAQDIQDINIDGFELVDNKEASGANFDYMSIHESKLVYILWKAVQEQQKEIEELKKLIK